MVSAVLALGHPEVEPARPSQLGAHTVPDVVEEVDVQSDESGVSLQDDLALEARRARMDPKISPVHQGFIGLVEEGVQVAYASEGHLVDDQLGFVRLEAVERRSAVGVHDERAVVELLHVTVQPCLGLVKAHVLGGLENGLEVAVDGQMLLKLGAGLHALLGVVLGYELLLEAEGDHRLAALEQFQKLQRSESFMVLLTVSMSSSVRYGCIGRERTREQREVLTGHSLEVTPVNAVWRCMGLG